MRIHIDRMMCVGAGQCARLAPELFSQDSEGFSILRSPGRDTMGDARAQDVSLACPVSAIRLTEIAD
ncbi:ferredoxin [Streptomyces sp. NPDC086783]|uniref:ferredoxin n=1 Tax=Streptomyces sp. NPDC086783 TaxID=3365758 RepID=UPI0038174321